MSKRKFGESTEAFNKRQMEDIDKALVAEPEIVEIGNGNVPQAPIKTQVFPPEEVQEQDEKGRSLDSRASIDTEIIPQSEIPTMADTSKRRGYMPNGSKDIVREERFSGMHIIEEIVDIFAKGHGLGAGGRLQIEATKACSGGKWYLLGHDTKYGLCATTDYQIISADGRLTARPANENKKYFERLGQFVAAKIGINSETGKPFTPKEEDGMLVDVRMFNPNNYQEQTNTNQGQEVAIKEKRKTTSVKLKDGSVMARFE